MPVPVQVRSPVSKNLINRNHKIFFSLVIEYADKGDEPIFSHLKQF
jgi:hypothetical protein